MVKRIQILVGMLLLASLIITGCESTQEKTLERNKELVRRVNDEVWNQGNLEIMEELYSTDVVRHFLPNGCQIRGLDKLRDRIRNHFIAFPDW